MSRSKIAIIGTRGHHGTIVREAAAMRDEVEIVAVAKGGNGDGALAIHDSQPRVFDDYRRMLDEASPDAVVVCGAFELHATMSIDAIERGIPVLTEKPAALTFEDLERLREACARHPSVHLAGMMFSRYAPGFLTASKLIADGAIGEVRLIETRKSYKLGHRDDFYQDRSTYGGTIPWVGSHAIDWILWLSGKPVETVYAAHAVAPDADSTSMARSALCHFTLADRVFASVAIDIFRPEKAPTHGDDFVRVVGAAGVMEIRPESLRLINATHDGSKPVPVSSDRSPLRDFLDHVNGTRTSLIDRESTLELTEACLLARQSADQRKVLLKREISVGGAA